MKKTAMKTKKRTRADAVDTDDIEKRIKPVSKIGTHIKAVVYGRSGTGKTTFAGSFPTPALLIDMNDQGTDSVLDVKGLEVIQAANWDDVESLYWYLQKNSKKYKTVILDTATMMQGFALEHVMDDRGKERGDKMTYKEWGEISGIMTTLLINFRDLPMNVVVNAQDKVFKGNEDEDDDDGQILPEVGPMLMPSVAKNLNAAYSVIGNTFIREKIIKVKKDGKIKEKRKTEYCLRVGPHTYYTTKVRKPKEVEVPAFIVDPTYKKLVDVLKGEE